MRRLIQITESPLPASSDDLMPHLDRVLELLQDGPKSPNDLQVSPRDFIALAHPNYVRPTDVARPRPPLTSKDCLWELTPLGHAYLLKKGAETPVTEEVNDDGEDSPLTRKRKRPRDPTSQKWFKELFSKKG